MYILYVEDEAALRSATQKQLRAQGINVDPAAAGEEGHFFLTGGQRYDAVLLDRMLPGGRCSGAARAAPPTS